MSRHLLFAGSLFILLLATGCLYAPTPPEQRRTGIDLVGGPGSGRPIEVGIANRDDVLTKLGPPNQTRAYGQKILYTYTPLLARRGYVGIGGPCGFCGYYPWEVRGRETLWLSFDENRLLTRADSSRQRE